MYVARIPNRGSPPAILLRESYREGGKVKNRTLANLSHWPEHKVDTLARALKGLPPKLELAEAFEITRSLPHGHVAAVLATAQRLGLAELIDPTPSRRRDLVMAMLIAAVIPDSESAPRTCLLSSTLIRGMLVHHCPTRRVYKKDTCLRIDLCTGTKRTLIDTNETSHPPYKGELRTNRAHRSGDQPMAEFQCE